jgi:hypothetical protein
MIKLLLTKYKFPLIAVALVWGFISFVQYFAISPLNNEIKDLKKEVKIREKLNVQLKAKVSKDSLLIIESDKFILILEEKEKYYNGLSPKIQLKYEKAKTDYYSKSILDRRRVFTGLANE